MKNLHYIPIFLAFILVFSCGQNTSEKKLNGKWFEIENDNRYNYWHFYKDSLVFAEERVEWKATQSTIQFDFPTFYWDSLGKPIDVIDKILINYQLSNRNDSLFGTLKNRYGTHKFSLIKSKNYIDFLNKKYGIEFSLPTNDTIKQIEIDDKYGLKIFIGYSNNKIIGKTELSVDLNQLESDIIMFKDRIKPTERPEFDSYNDFKFHLRVFADKKISDSIIAEHLIEKFNRKETVTAPIRIYRMYESKQDEKMKGKKIKTIANNV